ncbi:peptidase M23 [Plantactinospora sp. B5E13]|uniref:peptidase M23 n=1 Tax=Plantactinospora sp. B5E13 TaxID=3153758 RepID=UPI00325C43E7
MRDDDLSELEHTAVRRTVRSDDVPSSVPSSGLADAGRPRWRSWWAATLVILAGLRHRLGGGNRAWYAAAGVLCCLGLVAAVVGGTRSADPTADPGTVGPGDRVALSRPDQSTGGVGAGGPAEPSTAAGEAKPTDDSGPATSKTSPGESPPLADSAPVAGLTQVQMDNARAIVRTGRDMGMPRRALVIGVATAMQESNLLNRASEVVPESKRYPHQGTGWDHDSVGLFQQRSSSGWGPVGRLMDPAYATARFFEALRQVPGWQRMRLTEAAQAVQVSAYPEHYAKHEGNATRVVDALLPRDH